MGYVRKIDCTNCDYGETFSIGSTRRSHPSGGELKQCPSCDHIEVVWHERYVIELPEPEKRSINPVSRFLDWVEDKVLGPDNSLPRHKVVEADLPKICSKCGTKTRDFDFTSEDNEIAYHYINARCPKCRSKTLQSHSLPLGMFD